MSVTITPAARLALSKKAREWSGSNYSVEFVTTQEMHGETNGATTLAFADHVKQRFVLNPERLVLNPNRVLSRVTPFRLRQEGVLTGAMLHEAAHVRFTTWVPRSDEEFAAFTRADGTPVTKQEIELARLFEEVRIEREMALNADRFGARGLAWTMRASALHALPPTTISTDPEQAVMDVLRSWILRCGRVYTRVGGGPTPSWYDPLLKFVHGRITDHLLALGRDPQAASCSVAHLLDVCSRAMLTPQEMVETTPGQLPMYAKAVLAILFPDGSDASPAGGSGGCAAVSGNAGENEDSGEDAGEDAGEDSTGSESLAALEQQVAEDATDEVEQQARSFESKGGDEGEPTAVAGNGAGNRQVTFTRPNADNRAMQKGAERFLRSLVNPRETRKTSVTDSPSATVDGAALAAWKAGGSMGDPRFFTRLNRTVLPAPPVEIAILVDRSSSMDSLQKPSGEMAWALASAAHDMRNFAGHGQSVSSCLVYWGVSVHRMQSPGEVLPGVPSVRCNEGTLAMSEAMQSVSEVMPGFFDPSPTPRNRLLVQFTDWQVYDRGRGKQAAFEAVTNGVSMLTVLPGDVPKEPAALARFDSTRTAVVRYSSRNPGAVWQEAERLLGR